MALIAKTFSDFVTGQISAIKGSFAGVVDVGIGSITLALIESNSSVATYLQRLIVQLLATTRAATSKGADLDSWCADFGFYPPRFAASASTGMVTFSRFTSSGAVKIPVGTVVQTNALDKFIVVPDASNGNYSSITNDYTVNNGVPTLTVKAQSITPGAQANVLPNTITQIAQALPGIDTVANSSAFSGGADGESDEAVRARFVLWVSSLSKGTYDAVMYAAKSFSQSLDATLVENESYSGITQYGYFYLVCAKNGSALSEMDKTNLAKLIDAVRPLTSHFGVFDPAAIEATINVSLSYESGYLPSIVITQVASAITDYVNGLKIGGTLSYTRLINVIYTASSGVKSIATLAVNGGAADIVATKKQIITIASLTIS